MKKVLIRSYSSAINYVMFVFMFTVLFSSCSKDIKGDRAPIATDSREAILTLTSLSAAFDTSGLVAWYSFDSGSLKDRSAYHNNIVFSNGVVPAADRNGVANNAYYFNGTNSYMRIRNSPSLNPHYAVTLFATVKVDGFNAGKCHGNRILNKGFNDQDYGVYSLGYTDAFYTHNMNCSQPVDSAHETFESGYYVTGLYDTTQFVQKNRWYRLAYTYENFTSKFYIDGVLVSTARQSGNFLDDNDEDVFIGISNLRNKEYPYGFHGTIDQLAIFNVALTAKQVAKLAAY